MDATKVTTEERLEKLEYELAIAKRCNRRLLTLLILIAGGLGLVLTLTKTSSLTYAQETETVYKEIRANGFTLVDEKGKKRAELAVNKAGVALNLLDENGKHRVMLTMIASGPALSFRDENGQTRFQIMVYEQSSHLMLSDEKGQIRAGLNVVTGEHGAGLFLIDENANLRAALGARQTKTPDGKTLSYPESSLVLFGPDGNVVWESTKSEEYQKEGASQNKVK